MSRSLKFLQVSDCHLDSGLGSSRLALPPAKRNRLNRDMVNALMRSLEMAKRLEVDAVLVPGDVWDDESVGFQTAAQVYEAFGKLAPIPVIIAPGNHDPYHAFSYHNPAYYLAKVGKSHPANVHVFSTPEISSLQIPELEGVTFYGCCFTENRLRTERILHGITPSDSESLNILLLHGSQDDSLAPQFNKMMTAPFSSDELIASGFDYAALGHYHRYSTIIDSEGMVRAAYGGIPVARGLDEAGKHYVLLGEVQKGGVQQDSLLTEFVDVRQIMKLSVQVDSDITNSATAQDEISDALRAHGVVADDIVYVSLTGRLHPEIDRFNFDPAWCDEQCFHLHIDQDALEPEHNIKAILEDETAGKRIEGRFIQRMQMLISEAERNGDEKRIRLYKQALHYGLDSLQGREVKPRRVY